MALKIILIVFAAYVVLGYAISYYFLKQTFRRIDIMTDSVCPYLPVEAFSKMERNPVEFPSRGNILRGYIYRKKSTSTGKSASSDDLTSSDDSASKGLIVFSHGIWSGPEEYLMLIEALVEAGYEVFTYNYTSYNASEGKWAHGLANSMFDLKAALEYITNEPKFAGKRICLLGHSWGAYATCAVLKYDFPIAAAVSLSGFDEPMEMTIDAGVNMVGPLAKLLYPFIASLQLIYFGTDSNVRAHESINHAGIPVLLIHGVEDNFIKINSTAIYGKKDSITNPNVRYHEINRKGASGHNDYFGVIENNPYFNEKCEELIKLQKENSGKLPEGLKLKVSESYDIEKLTTIDPEFYNAVRVFLDSTV
jgi:alpha-beta hydrolase superfamily lysophospholipase